MRSLLFVLALAAMCTAAGAANTAYQNTTGGWVYEMDQPTSWANIGNPYQVLPGAGPDGTDAYYKPGAAGGPDDSTQAYWNFSWANLANFGTNNPESNPPRYAMQAYVSDYGGLSHEGDGVFGTWNGPWGYNANGWGQFSSWNGVPQSAPGWTTMGNWTGGYAWLSNTGNANDVTVGAKWNPWGGYGGFAVSGVRISTDGNFTPVPEPTSLLALLAGFPALALLRRKH